jgi:hypothetical protein
MRLHDGEMRGTPYGPGNDFDVITDDPVITPDKITRDAEPVTRDACCKEGTPAGRVGPADRAV